MICELCGTQHVAGEYWEHLARLESRRADRWRDIAETLWEELQEWHHDGCPTKRPGPDCTCHHILATLVEQASQ